MIPAGTWQVVHSISEVTGNGSPRTDDGHHSFPLRLGAGEMVYTVILETNYKSARNASDKQ